MFHQIINDMASKDNWDRIPNGFAFECNDYKEETIDLILTFFNLFNFDPSLHLFANDQNQSSKKIILSENDFKILHEGFKSYSTDQNLLTDGFLYDPLTPEEWIDLKNLIILKTTPQNNVKDDDINEKRKQAFFTLIKKETTHSVLTRRIFKELLLIQKDHQEKGLPYSLTVDMRESAQQILKENQAVGLASYQDNQPYIWLTIPTEENLPEFISSVLHEIRHIIQTGHKLYISQNKEPENYHALMTLFGLAREVEAKAYDLIIQPEKKQFVQAITHREIIIQVKKTFENPNIVPYGQNLSKPKKIGAFLRHIQIESHEKGLQILCNTYLTASRLSFYNFLKKHQISLTPEEFSEFADHIESWRNCYFPRKVLIKENKKREFLSKQKIKKTENEWEEKTGLKLSLSPTHIFSQEVAKALNIHSLIFKCENTRSNSIQMTYKGLESQTEDVYQMFKNGRYDEIYQLYAKIQEQNPILPKPHKSNPEYKNALFYALGLEEMKKRASLKNVLTTLGYSMIDKINLHPWKQKVKEEFQRS